MYKRVLAPLDGSELSECTFGDLPNVADKDSEIVLLRVLEPVVGRVRANVPGNVLADAGLPGDVFRGIEEKSLEAARDYLAGVAGRLAAKGYNVKTDVTDGKPADEILAYAERMKADVIVIGTHGRSGVTRMAYGSVTDRVIRTARIPLLVVAPASCRLG